MSKPRRSILSLRAERTLRLNPSIKTEKELAEALGISVTRARTILSADELREIITPKAFQTHLSRVDDTKIIDKVEEIALDTSDKRAALDAADKIFKLKDRYPAGKLKIQAYAEGLDRFGEPDSLAPEGLIETPLQ